MPRKLGILAGGGRLPGLLIDACRADGRPFMVIAFNGQAESDQVASGETHWLRLGAGRRILQTLKASGVEEVVLAGSIRRPGWRELRPDLWGIGFLLRTGALGKGDDGLLRELFKVFENRGMRVIGADQVLQGLITPPGTLTRRAPSDDDWRDIRAAWAGAAAIGRADRGQAAVARDGEVIAAETRSGTDAMLDAISPADGARRGVLVKCAKPGQELRADLPTSGPETVAKAAAAGLAGITLEAEKSITIDRSAMTELADGAGLFVIGVDAADVTDG